MEIILGFAGIFVGSVLVVFLHFFHYWLVSKEELREAEEIWEKEFQFIKTTNAMRRTMKASGLIR